MTYTRWRTIVALVNALCIGLCIALIWQIGRNIPAAIIAALLYITAMVAAQWAIRRECEAAEMQRLAALRRSQKAGKANPGLIADAGGLVTLDELRKENR